VAVAFSSSNMRPTISLHEFHQIPNLTGYHCRARGDRSLSETGYPLTHMDESRPLAELPAKGARPAIAGRYSSGV
jgi:hypothetical protein